MSNNYILNNNSNNNIFLQNYNNYNNSNFNNGTFKNYNSPEIIYNNKNIMYNNYINNLIINNNTNIGYYNKQNSKIFWNRCEFYISHCEGRIKTKFDINKLFNKLEKDDVEIIMWLLEKDTNKFFIIRLFLKIKVFFLILLIILIFLVLFYFLYYKNAVIGLILSLLSLTIFSFYLFVVNPFYKKRLKIMFKRVYPLLDCVNRKLFHKKGLYLTINHDFTYIEIYLVPDSVKGNLVLKNLISENVSKNNSINRENYELLNKFTLKNENILHLNNKTTIGILLSYIEVKQKLGLL